MANENRTTYVETGKGSGGTWVVALVLIVALVIGVVFASRMVGSETSKDKAVAGAASSVGDAAKDVGDAARDTANGGK